MKCRDCNRKQLVGYVDSDKKKIWCPAYMTFVRLDQDCLGDWIVKGFLEGFKNGSNILKE